MRLGRIAAGLAQCAPLTQQVPALIQFSLNVGQSFAVVCSLLEPVLFGYQALDMGEYGWVLARFFHGIPRWMQRELARCPTLDPLRRSCKRCARGSAIGAL